MKIRKKTVWRLIWLAVFLVIAAGLVLPRVDAGRFGNRVRQTLRQSLGLEVEFGEVHLDLFGGPGFSADNVVIYDDPRNGLEPLVYVDSLQARIRFTSLWAGKLEFSSLRLENPSVNLVRPAAGAPWNFERLLTRTVGAAAPGWSQPPEILVRGGRINFKLGDTKSIFYLTEAEMDCSPPSTPQGSWRLRWEAQPARTDRPAYGFGAFTGRATWRPDPRTGGDIDATVELARGSIGELFQLLHGRDVGVHGQVSTRMRLAGPVSDIHITGTAQVGDFHRWDLLPPRTGGWTVGYTGGLDMMGQRLELETVPVGGAPLPLSLRLRASGYLSRPEWGLIVTVNALPLAPLPEVARHMGLPLPPDLALDGDISGVIGYSDTQGIEGVVASRTASLKLAGVSPLEFESAGVVLDGSRVRFRVSPAGGRAVAEAEYDWKNPGVEASIVSRGMAIPEPASGAARLLGDVPLIRNCRTGTWTGQLKFSQAGGEAGVWAGALEIRDAEIALDGVADPLAVDSARIVVREGGAVMDRIRARLAAAAITGEYRYRPAATRPEQFQLAVSAIDAAEIERLFLSSLGRSDSLFARALRLGRRTPVPEWMGTRRAEGTIAIGALTFGAMRIENLKSHVRWDGASIELPDLSASFEGGVLTGQAGVNLGRAAPAYRLAARLRSLSWLGGEWDAQARVEAAGLGTDLYHNLSVEATFNARSISPLADTEFRTLSGTCTMTVPRDVPAFRCSDLQAAVGEDVYQGKGATGADGRLYFELSGSGGQKQLRLAGTASPFQLGLATLK